MDRVFEDWKARALLWLPEKGMGYFPVRPEDEPYDAAYFEKYRGYAQTEMGKQLTRCRVDFVDEIFAGEVVDVGIGSGDFIRTRGADTYGTDINPAAIHMLQLAGLWRELRPNTPLRDAATFWDSLEHLPDPGAVLSRIRRYVFVSLPIFHSGEHVVLSKHFRKNEHRWYWTEAGFEDWMQEQGFKRIAAESFEQGLGREDILTFAFERFGD